MYENYSVLFVDDEINILSSLKRGLLDEEYTCFFAACGKEAIEIMGKEKIAVIVSDMRMPEMDGLHLLLEIKAKWPDTIRIVLSGYTQLQQVLTTINQVDVFKFITKPWKLEEEFKHVIHSALDYYILHEENENNKIAIQNKNQAYLNILKSIEIVISNAKRSSRILGACGKAILTYKCSSIDDKDESMQFFSEKIYELFIEAVIGDEREYDIFRFEQEFSSVIQSRINVVKIENKLGSDLKIKTIPSIIEAVIVSCLTLFFEEFSSYGLYVNYGLTHKKNVTITLLTVKEIDTQNQKKNSLNKTDKKISFINSILKSTVSLCDMDFYAGRKNGRLLLVLSLV